ncbi:hypothetical protein HYU23_03185 [Candidatus Woesearchaeota archaeon]|nr:hypothetical protein [Candidatus Woesearchaeota archaeon]
MKYRDLWPAGILFTFFSLGEYLNYKKNTEINEIRDLVSPIIRKDSSWSPNAAYAMILINSEDKTKVCQGANNGIGTKYYDLLTKGGLDFNLEIGEWYRKSSPANADSYFSDARNLYPIMDKLNTYCGSIDEAVVDAKKRDIEWERFLRRK